VIEHRVGSTEPRFQLDYPINESDFLSAAESASKTKKALQQLGLRPEVVKNSAIIVYEAAMNIVIHATSGRLRVIIVSDEVVIRAEDVGPGIPDIELAMQVGYSTAPHEIREMGFGAGMGLANMKRCSDKLTIKSEPGVGTILEARIYLGQKGSPHETR
jgi:serine/threonine-protein kinase RsbT